MHLKQAKGKIGDKDFVSAKSYGYKNEKKKKNFQAINFKVVPGLENLSMKVVSSYAIKDKLL